MPVDVDDDESDDDESDDDESDDDDNSRQGLIAAFLLPDPQRGAQWRVVVGLKPDRRG